MKVAISANIRYMVIHSIRLLSRVTPRVTILSEGRTGVPAMFTPVKGGKLRRRVDVLN